MKILHVCPGFYPKVGGVEKYVYQLAREQVKMGHEVVVVCRSESGIDESQNIDGIQVFRIGCKQRRGIRVFDSMGKIVNKIREIDADIYHAHDWTQSLACMLAKKKFVTTVQGYGGLLESIPLINNVLRGFVENSQKIAVNHEFLLKKYPKATYIHAGISLKEYPFKKITNKKTILIVSRLSPERHVDIAIKGFIALANPNLKLIIAGDGPEMENLKAMCKSRSNITFLGFRTDIPKLITEATIVYGGPLTVIEALAVGRPALIVRDKDTGLISNLYTIRNPEEFVCTAKYFLGNLDRESKTARQIAEKEFDIKEVAKKYDKFYEEAK